MTISYQFNVATASFAGFPKLLLRWKGSVYKLVYKEVLLFATLYVAMSMVYRCALNEDQRRVFEQVCLHMEVSVNFIPLTFVLGFYVSFVVGRWWDQFSSYPWPDSVSIVAKKRFPTFDHLVEAGLLTKEELGLFEKVEIQYAKFWIPLVWFTQLVDQARQEGSFHDPSGGMKQVMDELMNYRDKQGKIWAYDYVSIPIVYTQVVTLATYMYFVGCLFSRQFLDPAQKYENYHVDIYVPFFTLLQFFFYVGWLKVAESLINPWGEDDDDFEVNWFIDRHMQVSYAIVDDMHGKRPELQKDKYWNERDVVLPYTQAAMDAQRKPRLDHLGSTMNLNVPASARLMRRPSAEAALGSSANLVLRKRNRKLSRQEDIFAYLPRNASERSFDEVSIAVPTNPYARPKSAGGTTGDVKNAVRKDENGYLTPGFPVLGASEIGRGDQELVEARFRKVSSPARTAFYAPDKEILAKYNARLRTISDSNCSEEAENEEKIRTKPEGQGYEQLSNNNSDGSSLPPESPPKTESFVPLLSQEERDMV